MTAMVTAAVIGVGGSMIAGKSASKATKAAAQSEAAALEFEQQRYDDWKEVYGPIQTNLANYYSNLTPEYYETIGLETFEQESQVAMQRLDESLAQRGITDSGISASLQLQNELEGAEGRAAIRRDAPRMAAEDKTRFLQIGLGQNPAQAMSNALQREASGARSRASQAEATAGRAIGEGVAAVGTALVDYANNKGDQI